MDYLFICLFIAAQHTVEWNTHVVMWKVISVVPQKAGHCMIQQVLFKSTEHRRSLRSSIVAFAIVKSRYNSIIYQGGNVQQNVAYSHDKVLFCPKKPKFNT